MNTVIAAAQVRDSIVVRIGGRASTYKIIGIAGNKARELRLEGRCGSQRVLVDGGDSIWIREASTRHRRVTSVELLPWVDRTRLESVLTGEWQTETEIAAAIFGTAQPTEHQAKLVHFSATAFRCGESSWRLPGPVRYRDPKQVDRDREGAEMLARIRERFRGEAAAEHYRRCRQALQQILELAKGIKPSGDELTSELPEQVVAEVGHALRIEGRG